MHDGAVDGNPYRHYSITLPTEAGTVYGGKLDVINGELVVEMLSVTIDNSKIIRDSATRYHVAKSNIGTFLSSGDSAMNKFRRKTSSDNYSASGTFFTDTNNLQMNAYRAFDTRNDFVEAYGELQFVFTLTTPIEIQLDAHTINSLYGQNNIWANTGDAEVTYRADTTLYIKRLTESDTDMVSDSNIVSGQYFMVGNNLYRATVNIASGAQVIEGTNATKVSLATALNEINA